jgi:hypothetical protein
MKKLAVGQEFLIKIGKNEVKCTIVRTSDTGTVVELASGKKLMVKNEARLIAIEAPAKAKAKPAAKAKKTAPAKEPKITIAGLDADTLKNKKEAKADKTKSLIVQMLDEAKAAIEINKAPMKTKDLVNELKKNHAGEWIFTAGKATPENRMYGSLDEDSYFSKTPRFKRVGRGLWDLV